MVAAAARPRNVMAAEQGAATTRSIDMISNQELDTLSRLLKKKIEEINVTSSRLSCAQLLCTACLSQGTAGLF
jgi:hypothetical protein